MKKRLVWLTAGFGLGIAAARRARRSAGTAGGASASRAGGLAGWLRSHVNAAMSEGRREARQREVALRNVLAAPKRGPHNPER
jgi:hypothetical protein